MNILILFQHLSKIENTSFEFVQVFRTNEYKYINIYICVYILKRKDYYSNLKLYHNAIIAILYLCRVFALNQSTLFLQKLVSFSTQPNVCFVIVILGVKSTKKMAALGSITKEILVLRPYCLRNFKVVTSVARG